MGCNVKGTKDGFLFMLDAGLLFVTAPLMFLSYSGV